MNNSFSVTCFKKPQQCCVPKDMSAYKTPILTEDKQYLTQLVVVVCDLLLMPFGFKSH